MFRSGFEIFCLLVICIAFTFSLLPGKAHGQVLIGMLPGDKGK